MTVKVSAPTTSWAVLFRWSLTPLLSLLSQFEFPVFQRLASLLPPSVQVCLLRSACGVRAFFMCAEMRKHSKYKPVDAGLYTPLCCFQQCNQIHAMSSLIKRDLLFVHTSTRIYHVCGTNLSRSETFCVIHAELHQHLLWEQYVNFIMWSQNWFVNQNLFRDYNVLVKMHLFLCSYAVKYQGIAPLLGHFVLKSSPESS